MQIIKIYDKNCDLRSNRENVFKTMDKFLSKYPAEYRKLYDKNLSTLELFKCDELDDLMTGGIYDEENNIIFFVKSWYIGHELFHMASTDRNCGIVAIESPLHCEDGIIEGMTEYLFMKAFELNGPTAYEFETFAVDMLNNIPDLFKYYFIPNHSEFIKLFPNRKDIYNLMFSLDSYHEKYMEYLDCLCNKNEYSFMDCDVVRKSIRQVINNLITIELSFEKDKHYLKKYSDKFMDLIGSYEVSNVVSEIYPKYYGYAETQVKNRILKR